MDRFTESRIVQNALISVYHSVECMLVSSLSPPRYWMKLHEMVKIIFVSTVPKYILDLKGQFSCQYVFHLYFSIA